MDSRLPVSRAPWAIVDPSSTNDWLPPAAARADLRHQGTKTPGRIGKAEAASNLWDRSALSAEVVRRESPARLIFGIPQLPVGADTDLICRNFPEVMIVALLIPSLLWNVVGKKHVGLRNIEQREALRRVGCAERKNTSNRSPTGGRSGLSRLTRPTLFGSLRQLFIGRNNSVHYAPRLRIHHAFSHRSRLIDARPKIWK
jgi:hypothetical protein